MRPVADAGPRLPRPQATPAARSGFHPVRPRRRAEPWRVAHVAILVACARRGCAGAADRPGRRPAEPRPASPARCRARAISNGDHAAPDDTSVHAVRAGQGWPERGRPIGAPGKPGGRTGRGIVRAEPPVAEPGTGAAAPGRGRRLAMSDAYHDTNAIRRSTPPCRTGHGRSSRRSAERPTRRATVAPHPGVSDDARAFRRRTSRRRPGTAAGSERPADPRARVARARRHRRRPRSSRAPSTWRHARVRPSTSARRAAEHGDAGRRATRVQALARAAREHLPRGPPPRSMGSARLPLRRGRKHRRRSRAAAPWRRARACPPMHATHRPAPRRRRAALHGPVPPADPSIATVLLRVPRWRCARARPMTDAGRAGAERGAGREAPPGPSGRPTGMRRALDARDRRDPRAGRAPGPSSRMTRPPCPRGPAMSSTGCVS